MYRLIATKGKCSASTVNNESRVFYIDCQQWKVGFLRQRSTMKAETSTSPATSCTSIVNKEMCTLDIVRPNNWEVKGKVWSRFWCGNLSERDHWGDQDVDGRIILRQIYRKWEGVVVSGGSWLRIGTFGGRLWVRWWTLGFHKMRGISWLAAKPVSFSRRTLLHGISK